MTYEEGWERKSQWEAFRAGAYRYGEHLNEDNVRNAFDQWWARQLENWSITELDLPVRLYNVLSRRYRVRTIGEARRWLVLGAHPDYPGEIAAYNLRNIGIRTIEAAQDRLRRFDEQHTNNNNNNHE